MDPVTSPDMPLVDSHPSVNSPGGLVDRLTALQGNRSARPDQTLLEIEQRLMQRLDEITELVVEQQRQLSALRDNAEAGRGELETARREAAADSEAQLRELSLHVTDQGQSLQSLSEETSATRSDLDTLRGHLM